MKIRVEISYQDLIECKSEHEVRDMVMKRFEGAGIPPNGGKMRMIEDPENYRRVYEWRSDT